MDFNNLSIGVDIEEIRRFEGKTTEADGLFLSKIFTKNELEYCFKKKNPAPSLTARFCAKEAVVKALSGFKIYDVYYSDIEVLKNEDNSPYIKIQKHPEIEAKVSLSHSKKDGIAYVIIEKK